MCRVVMIVTGYAYSMKYLCLPEKQKYIHLKTILT